MRVRIAAILVTALLLGCTTPPVQKGVLVVWMKTPADEVHDVCRTATRPLLLGGRVLGCYIRNGEVCTVYSPDFTDERDKKAMATLGHEMKHCFDGHWHAKNAL